MITRQIGWSNESNLLYQILKQITRLSSIIFSLKQEATPKYKVFTALLTQEGGYEQLFKSDGELVIGKTYQIDPENIGLNCDFTIVGAPNNDPGTYFIATGETPIWGNSTLYYNVGAPTAKIIENTIGNIWFSAINNPGTFEINSNGLFTLNKTINNLDQIRAINSNTEIFYYVYCSPQNSSILNLLTGDDSLTLHKNLLFERLLEIRVYN